MSDGYLCRSWMGFAFSRPRQVKRALNLVQMMRCEGLVPTGVTHNILLRLCGLGGCWATGLELMAMMEVRAAGQSLPGFVGLGVVLGVYEPSCPVPWR